jgi:hypothetical protein
MTDTGRLDPAALLGMLGRGGVDYVVAGSVAAMAFGVDLVPGDLDVVPSLDPANLERLGLLLHRAGAKPRHVPGWREGLDREACERWRPEPFDLAALDHRFVTPWGDLDVVPLKAGRYDELGPTAVSFTAFGCAIQVAHPDHLIAQLDRWDRPRDRARRAALVDARARFLSGETPPPLDAHRGWAVPTP